MCHCCKPLTSKEIGISESWKWGRGKAKQADVQQKPVKTRPGAGRWDVRCAAKGITSALAAVQREKPESGGMNTSLSSPNITLSFFPLFHKNAWEEESRTCFPRAKALFGSSWSPLLKDLEQCYLLHTRRAKRQLTHQPSWESAGSVPLPHLHPQITSGQMTVSAHTVIFFGNMCVRLTPNSHWH